MLPTAVIAPGAGDHHLVEDGARCRSAPGKNRRAPIFDPLPTPNTLTMLMAKEAMITSRRLAGRNKQRENKRGSR